MISTIDGVDGFDFVMSVVLGQMALGSVAFRVPHTQSSISSFFFSFSLFSVFKTLFQIEVSRHSFSAGFVPLSRLSHASTDDWFVTSLSC